MGRRAGLMGSVLLGAVALTGCSQQQEASETTSVAAEDMVGTWVGTYAGFSREDEYVTWEVTLEFTEVDGVGFRGYRNFIDEFLEPASEYVKGVVTPEGHVTMLESDSVFEGELDGSQLVGTFRGAGDAQSVFVVSLTKEGQAGE